MRFWKLKNASHLKKITRRTTGARGYKFELLTMSNNFLGLSWFNSVYFGLYGSISVHHGVSWAISVYLGLYQSISVYLGLHRSIALLKKTWDIFMILFGFESSLIYSSKKIFLRTVWNIVNTEL